MNPGSQLASFFKSAILARLSAPKLTRNTEWPWFFAATLDLAPVGPTRANPRVPWITRFGAVPPWVHSMNGQVEASWKSRKIVVQW